MPFNAKRRSVIKSLDELSLISKGETKEEKKSDKPDLLSFVDDRSGEVLFKVTGDMQIQFGHKIVGEDASTMAFMKAISSYLPKTEKDIVAMRTALHYCYAAMKAYAEASANGQELTKESQKLWEVAMQKAEECFY